jgi:hypothetical protein
VIPPPPPKPRANKSAELNDKAMQHAAAIFQGVRFTVEFSRIYLRLIAGGFRGNVGTRL